MRRGGQRGVDVAHLVEVVRGDVVRHVGVHRPLGPARVVDADDRWQHVVPDDDPSGGVFRQVAVEGHHHHHGLADVVDLVAGQRVAGAWRGQGGVRDQQRQRLGHRGAFRLVGGCQVLVGVDRDEPLDVEGAGGVDVGDPRVGVRAADERGGERVQAEVVEEVRAAGHQLHVLDPLHGLAEQLRRHASPAWRVSSAARSTAATMFW